MNRRAFITGLGALLAVPFRAEAQRTSTVWRIGTLDSAFLARPHWWESFREGLRQLGHVEGQDISFETRNADEKVERLPSLAADLVRLHVDVIVTAGTPAALAAKRATAAIPIVMAVVGDPVALNLVASLARPGGNVTGLTSANITLTGKRLALLREVVPGMSRLALLWDQTNPAAELSEKDTETAAGSLGVHLRALGVRSPSEFDSAFSTLIKERTGALLVGPSPMFFSMRRRLADLALKNALPTMFGTTEYAQAGGLMAYSPDNIVMFRRAATYVDKILKGAKPADLPIEQPTKFELVINLKTAKALGLTIPPSLLLRADQVIE
jgi:ABC-type uncharacterized transport system substrate-binding protein